MRAVIRAGLAGHPLIAMLLVAMRWLVWLLLGQPIGLVLSLGFVWLGLPLVWSLGTAAAVEGVLSALAAGTASGSGRLLWSWKQGCRFRRRWPAAFVDTNSQTRRDTSILLPGNYYSTPDGLRPVLYAPRLSILPRSVTVDSMTWTIRPWDTRSFASLGAEVRRVARADRRVTAAEVIVAPGRRRDLQLVVSFKPGGREVSPPYSGPSEGRDRRDMPDPDGSSSNGGSPSPWSRFGNGNRPGTGAATTHRYPAGGDN